MSVYCINTFLIAIFYNDKNGGIYLNWEDFVGTLQVEASSGDGCQN